MVEPGQRITLDGRWWTVSKAVVAPSGGGLVLTGAGRLSAGNFFIRGRPGQLSAMQEVLWYGFQTHSARLGTFCRLLAGGRDMESPSPWCPYEWVYPGR